MRKIDTLVVHCSDSEFGDAETIRQWHTDPKPLGRGWGDIGYHYVILNGRRKSRGRYRKEDDGRIEVGRPLSRPGAHCRGHNKSSVGVCLIGRHHFTAKQLLEALPGIIREIGLTAHHIIVKGHYEYDSGKTCPNIDMKLLTDKEVIK